MMLVKRKRTIIIFLIAVLLVVAALLFSMRIIWSIVQENTIDTMQEIVAHDKKSIEGENNFAWEQLRQIYERTKESGAADIREVCNRLNMESSASYFEGVYLVDTEGRTYSHTGNIKDGSGTEPVMRILANEDSFAVNYRTGISMERYRDYLVYGITFPAYSVGDVQFIGLYVMTSISAMEDRMELGSFSGQGLTSVFDEDGYYVVRQNQKINIAIRENYFEQVKEKYGCTDEEVDALKAQIETGEPFTMQFADEEDGTVIIVCYEHMEEVDWTMILEVPESAISTRVKRVVFIMYAIILLITVVVLTLTLYLMQVKWQTKHVQEQAKIRSQFLANMSHEIRTPLNGIIGLNHLMTVNLNSPDKLKEYLAKSSVAEKYLLSLINDILDVQKLQAGKMELVSKPFSLDAMINSLDILIRERMNEKGIAFVIEKDIVCPSIVGDEMRIKQILINILGNAVKFTETGGHVHFRIRQSETQAGKILTHFEIEDDGCGMSSDFCRVIFEPFSQERMEKTASSVRGTGLGMNISYELAKRMGGSLSVESELGKGSCFVFELESTPATPDTPVMAAQDEPSVGVQQPLHILIAEDNELNAEILSELLHIQGHSTEVAADGQEAVEKFEASDEGSFDLILMDMQMPRLTGTQAAERIRALPRPDAKTVLIFACTANTFQEDIDMAKRAGMNDFIAKPVDVTKLIEKIKNVRGQE